jgi:hypothetical protein
VEHLKLILAVVVVLDSAQPQLVALVAEEMDQTTQQVQAQLPQLIMAVVVAVQLGVRMVQMVTMEL